MDPILQENAIASAMNSINEATLVRASEAAISELAASEVVADASEVVAAANEVVTTTEEEADAVLDAIVDAVILDDEEPEMIVPAVIPPVLETIIEENVSVPETITFKIPEPPAVTAVTVATEIQAPAVTVAPALAEPANEVPPAAPSAQAELPKQTPSNAVLAVAEAVAVFAEACAAAAKTVTAAKTAAVATVDAISKVSAPTASAGAEPVMKKYRAASYDKHDETYAKELTRIFNDYVDIETQIKFMEKTDELMSEPRISRFCLLGAISDYEKTTDSRKYPFPVIFTDAAFNYRPHQPCVIC